MRIKLLVDVAGPFGVYYRGELADLPDDPSTLGLVANGYAELVEMVAPPVADTTNLEPPVMAAHSPRPRRGKRS